MQTVFVLTLVSVADARVHAVYIHTGPVIHSPVVQYTGNIH